MLFWLVAFAFATFALPAERAHAGVVGETAENFAKKVSDDPATQTEIGNAVDTLVKVAPDAHEAAGELTGAAKGARPTRNISGPFEDLLVNFDKLACAAWIVSFRDRYLEVMLRKDPEASPETLAAAQNLLNKVIYACRKVIDPETYELEAAAHHTGPQPATDPAPGPADGPGAARIDWIDGVKMSSAADNICWNRCRDKWSAWKGAQGIRQRAEDRLNADRLHADTLEQSTIPDDERLLAAAEAQLRDLQARAPKYPQHDPKIDGDIGRKSAEIGNMRTQMAGHKADLAATRQEIRDLEAKLPNLRQREDAARQAYLDCMKGCRDQARAAGDPSSFAEHTVEQLLSMTTRVSMLPTPVDTRTAQMLYVPPQERETAYAALLDQMRELRERQGQVNRRGDDDQPDTAVSTGMPAPVQDFRERFMPMRESRGGMMDRGD